MIDKYLELPRADPTLLYAEDLLGKEATLEISDYKYEVTDEKKTMLTVWFKGKKKRLRLNATNQRCWWKLFGKKDPSIPQGKSITIRALEVEAFGEMVDGIRIVGAPWMREAISFMVPQGRKKAKYTLVPTGRGMQPDITPEPAATEPTAESAS